MRFHIIDPILRKLGYADGDDVYLKLEEKLDYPYYHIGHRNKKRDLPLGFPDYRAGIKGGRGSFIIEAKAATVGIATADIEQAHSYAAHAQVGANYFVLCDGVRFVVHETLSGHQVEPILDIAVVDIDARYHELEHVLAPANLERHCRVSYDFQMKLCEGLGSSVPIASGLYTLEGWDLRVFINGQDCTDILTAQVGPLDGELVALKDNFELRVGEGFVSRDADGRIKAEATFSGATKNNQKAMQLLGVDRVVFSTGEQFLSLDPTNPSVFESTGDVRIAKGSEFPPLFGAALPLTTDVDADFFIRTRMALDNKEALGDYVAAANYHFASPLGQVRLELYIAGLASLKLQL